MEYDGNKIPFKKLDSSLFQKKTDLNFIKPTFLLMSFDASMGTLIPYGPYIRNIKKIYHRILRHKSTGWKKSTLPKLNPKY